MFAVMQRRTLNLRMLNLVKVLSLGLGCAIFLGACDDGKYRAQLDAIVREGVTEDQLPARLNMKFEVYQRGEPSWVDLQTFLGREPAENFGPVREAVQKYPRILYHTTQWRMTWLFVDQKGVVREYFLSAQ